MSPAFEVGFLNIGPPGKLDHLFMFFKKKSDRRYVTFLQMTLFLIVTQCLIRDNRKKNSSLALPLELGGTSLLISLTVFIVIITKTYCHLKKSPECSTSQELEML